jgi:hypothetical protein
LSAAVNIKSGCRKNRDLDKILRIRLPAEKLEEMRQEAPEFGTSPSALERIWILDTHRRLDGNKPQRRE